MQSYQRLSLLSLLLIVPTLLSASEQKKQAETKTVASQSIVFKGHTAPVAALAKITPIVFASVDTAGTIKVWSLKGNCFTTISPKKPAPVKALAGISDSLVATLASPSPNGIWNLDTNNGVITATVVNFAKKQLTDEDELTLWDLKTGKAIQAGKGIKYSKRSDHTWIEFGSLDNKPEYITLQATAFAGYDQSWETKTARPLALTTFSIVTPYSFPVNQEVTAYAWLSKTKLATGWENGNIRIWTNGAKTKQEGAYVLEGPKGRVTALAKLSDNLLASASEDGTIFVWDLTTRKAQIFPGHTQAVRVLLPLSPTLFLSGSDDMTIRVWDLKELETSQKQAEHKQQAEVVQKLDLKFTDTPKA
jgi:WD40 repeat protein